jgi:site-specific recombinase XerD
MSAISTTGEKPSVTSIEVTDLSEAEGTSAANGVGEDDTNKSEVDESEVDKDEADEVASSSAWPLMVLPAMLPPADHETAKSFSTLLAHAEEIPGAAAADGRPTDAQAALTYLASLAPKGRRTMQLRLEQVAQLVIGRRDLRAVPWSRLRYEHLTVLRSALQEQGLSTASVNATIYAVRGVAKAAWNLGLMTADDYGRLRNVGPLRGHRLPAGRSLAQGELHILFDAVYNDRSPAGTRDAALLAVLYSGGLRRAEAAALDIADYEEASGALKVRGKGNKERLVYILGGAALAMADWCLLRGNEAGALFYPINKGGRITPRRMTDQAIYNILVKRALASSVLRFSPHDLRRTFVGDLLDRGVDIVTVQQLAGHANVTTTARYDRRGERVKAQGAGTLHIPYRSRQEK